MTGPQPGAPTPGPSHRPRSRAASRRTTVRTTRRSRHGVATALFVALLAACSTGAGGDLPVSGAVAPSLVVAPGADCLAPQVLAALGFDPAGYAGSPHPDAPESTPLPTTGFTAASAVLCSTGETLTDAAGRWAAVTATRLEGEVAPLVAALADAATPDGVRRSRAAATACPVGERRSDLWLVDALGAAVRVELPGGGCGNLPTAVAAGLTALDAVDVEHYPVDLVVPGASASARPTAG